MLRQITEKMLSRKRFDYPKVLRRGEGDANNLVRNLDKLDVKAGKNPKNFGHNLVFGFVSQLAADLQTNCFGRHMITKAKNQKGKRQKSEKAAKRKKVRVERR